MKDKLMFVLNQDEYTHIIYHLERTRTELLMRGSNTQMKDRDQCIENLKKQHVFNEHVDVSDLIKKYEWIREERDANYE